MTTIRALRLTDDRSTFRSGDVDLDRFFAKYAAQNQFKHHIGTTYVALDNAGVVVGYVTVAAASIEVESLPSTVTKRLPAYPLPVLRLARLAVAETAQGQGIGPALLKYVFGLALRLADDLGCVGVVVDAYTERVGFYAQYGFFEIDVVEGESSARPQPTPMFLALSEIRAASR